MPDPISALFLSRYPSLRPPIPSDLFELLGYAHTFSLVDTAAEDEESQPLFDSRSTPPLFGPARPPVHLEYLELTAEESEEEDDSSTVTPGHVDTTSSSRTVTPRPPTSSSSSAHLSALPSSTSPAGTTHLAKPQLIMSFESRSLPCAPVWTRPTAASVPNPPRKRDEPISFARASFAPEGSWSPPISHAAVDAATDVPSIPTAGQTYVTTPVDEIPPLVHLVVERPQTHPPRRRTQAMTFATTSFASIAMDTGEDISPPPELVPSDVHAIEISSSARLSHDNEHKIPPSGLAAPLDNTCCCDNQLTASQVFEYIANLEFKEAPLTHSGDRIVDHDQAEMDLDAPGDSVEREKNLDHLYSSPLSEASSRDSLGPLTPMVPYTASWHRFDAQGKVDEAPDAPEIVLTELDVRTALHPNLLDRPRYPSPIDFDEDELYEPMFDWTLLGQALENVKQEHVQ